jgi:hypothetical protein
MNCLHFTSTWANPRYLVVSVFLIFLISYVVLFALFVFVLCLVYPMLPVSLDFAFLIAPLVFSNISLHLRLGRFSRRLTKNVHDLNFAFTINSYRNNFCKRAAELFRSNGY